MTTYEESDLAQIANAIGMDGARIAKHGNLFEAAAIWYRLDERRPRRIPPSKLWDKLDRIAKSAHRLLKNLHINDPDEAANGPGDPEIHP